jgi:hypothetical protein
MNLLPSTLNQIINEVLNVKLLGSTKESFEKLVFEDFIDDAINYVLTPAGKIKSAFPP